MRDAKRRRTGLQMQKTIHVQQLRPGMFVLRLHGSWLKHPFWRKSFVVDADDVALLQHSHVEHVDIDARRGHDVAGADNDSPAQAVDDAQRAAARPAAAESASTARMEWVGFAAEVARARRICAEGRDVVESMFREARMGRALDVDAAVPLAMEISASVMRHPGALVSVARLKTADDYTYLHSVAVSALMVALARELGLPEEARREAAMGGLLHDLGKARMPLAILNKPGRLSDDEFRIVRTHPAEGEQLLRESGVENRAVLHMVRHHHERMDGAGYPDALDQEGIPLLTRMSAVCDVYDAVTSNRPYKPGWDPAESLRRMASWQGHFDTDVFKALVRSLGIYPIGSLVRLSSERLAVVIEQGAHTLAQPKVRVFYSIKSRSHVLNHDIDLAASGCTERITDVESPSKWGFRRLENLWLG